MKITSLIGLLFSSAVFIASGSWAQASGATQFTVTQGQVTITPAWCAERPCPTTSASLSGQFAAEISHDGRGMLVTQSALVTDPATDFQLPADPAEDSNGTVRDIEFIFDGINLTAKGLIDSRAFDRPLLQYTLVASAQQAQFYTARPDYRKCIAPLCGGYFVKAVNKKLTQCADGRRQAECYVSRIDFNKTPLSYSDGVGNATPLLLTGAIVAKPKTDFGTPSVFIATSAYRSATQKTAVETFYSARNNGIMCITTPCFSYDETRLNSPGRIVKLSDVNLEMSGATPDDIAQAQSLMANGEAIYVSGHNESYRGFAGTGLRLVAQQFYLPIKAATCEDTRSGPLCPAK